MTVHNTHHVCGLHTDTQVQTKKCRHHKKITSVTTNVAGVALGHKGVVSVRQKANGDMSISTHNVKPRRAPAVSAAITTALRKNEKKIEKAERRAEHDHAHAALRRHRSNHSR